MEKRVIYISSGAAVAAIMVIAGVMVLVTNNHSSLSSGINNNNAVSTTGSTQSPSSQQAEAQVPAGQVFISMYVVAWDPMAVETWKKTHPEFFNSNEVVLDDSMLVQSPLLKEALQGAVEKKFEHDGPGTYTVEPLSASDLGSVTSIIGTSKFDQLYTETESNFNEKGEVIGKVLNDISRVLVKYGDDYLYVTIQKITILE